MDVVLSIAGVSLVAQLHQCFQGAPAQNRFATPKLFIGGAIPRENSFDLLSEQLVFAFVKGTAAILHRVAGQSVLDLPADFLVLNLDRKSVV